MVYGFINPELAHNMFSRLVGRPGMSIDLNCPAFATNGDAW